MKMLTVPLYGLCPINFDFISVETFYFSAVKIVKRSIHFTRRVVRELVYYKSSNCAIYSQADTVPLHLWIHIITIKILYTIQCSPWITCSLLIGWTYTRWWSYHSYCSLIYSHWTECVSLTSDWFKHLYDVVFGLIITS